MIRRLTLPQYHNTLVDLFQDANVPEDDVLTDPSILGFRVDANAALVRDLGAEQLMNYAERVAAWVVDERIWTVANCNNLADAACRRSFIQDFGLKIHREPLSEERIAGYEGLMLAESSFEDGVEVALTAMLQSPYLLYRRELGVQNGNSYELTPYEIASELSYMLAGTTPDEQLLEAAKNGALSTQEQLDQHAARLLNTEQAKEQLAGFVEGWVGADEILIKAKDPAVFDLPATLRQAMLEETRELFLETFYTGGTIADLFSADYTYVNGELGQFYGLGGGGAEPQRVEIPDGARLPGLLGHGAFLTTHALQDESSPVQRGGIVRERLLCQTLPEIPEGLDTNLDTDTVFTTQRERYEQHSADPTCRGCHEIMDPIGFSFEGFDGFGRKRTSAVDTSGELTNVPEGSIPLSDATDLAAYLASSDTARTCVVRFLSYYMYGRDHWVNPECNRDAVRAEAKQSNYSLQSVVAAMTHAPHFTARVKDE